MFCPFCLYYQLSIVWWVCQTIRVSPFRQTPVSVLCLWKIICSFSICPINICWLSRVSSIRYRKTQPGWRSWISGIFSPNTDGSIYPIFGSSAHRSRYLEYSPSSNWNEYNFVDPRVWWKMAGKSWCVFHSSQCHHQRKSFLVIHFEWILWSNSSGFDDTFRTLGNTSPCGSCEWLERIDCGGSSFPFWEYSPSTVSCPCWSGSQTVAPAP